VSGDVAALVPMDLNVEFLIDALDAASHTYKIVFFVGAVDAGSSDYYVYPILQFRELTIEEAA
jgi:hypothetical protein